jgi:hypothetical protein
MPIWGIKLSIQINQVFPTALKKTLSANNFVKLSNQIKSLWLDIRVVLVRLRPNVFNTGYKPKRRKPMMNGARNRYPVGIFFNLARFILPP